MPEAIDSFNVGNVAELKRTASSCAEFGMGIKLAIKAAIAINEGNFALGYFAIAQNIFVIYTIFGKNYAIFNVALDNAESNELIRVVFIVNTLANDTYMVRAVFIKVGFIVIEED